MIFHKECPPDWNLRINSPFMSKEYAEASKKDYGVYYCQEGNSQALILIKKKILKVFSRAQILTESEDANFLMNLLKGIKKMGVPYARIGNTMFGLKNFIDLKDAKRIERNTMVLDLKRDLDSLWKKFDKKLRNSIRKSEKESVRVSELINEEELKEYYDLSLKTERHIKESKGRKAFSIQSYEFYKKIIEDGLGRVFLAKFGDKIIAGSVFLVFGNRTIYFQSGFLREYAIKQAPSLIHWEAIKKLKKEGITEYDLGGLSLGLTKEDSRYFIYEFKKKFNGQLEVFYNLEIPIIKYKKTIQDKFVKIIYGKQE